MDTSIIDRVSEQMKLMPQEKQIMVLEFVKNVAASTPRGISGSQLIKFAGTIPPDDIKAIRKAIQQDCKQINPNER